LQAVEISTSFLILETDINFVKNIHDNPKIAYQCHSFFEKVDYSFVRDSKLGIGFDMGLQPRRKLLLEASVSKSSVAQQNSTKVSFVPDDSANSLVHSS
jgi:hypothetical protein